MDRLTSQPNGSHWKLRKNRPSAKHNEEWFWMSNCFSPIPAFIPFPHFARRARDSFLFWARFLLPCTHLRPAKNVCVSFVMLFGHPKLACWGIWDVLKAHCILKKAVEQAHRVKTGFQNRQQKAGGSFFNAILSSHGCWARIYAEGAGRGSSPP